MCYHHNVKLSSLSVNDTIVVLYNEWILQVTKNVNFSHHQFLLLGAHLPIIHLFPNQSFTITLSLDFANLTERAYSPVQSSPRATGQHRGKDKDKYEIEILAVLKNSMGWLVTLSDCPCDFVLILSGFLCMLPRHD